ncbi:MAG: hypothetical protein AAF738_05570 [Bacteroidota bacterium]
MKQYRIFCFCLLLLWSNAWNACNWLWKPDRIGWIPFDSKQDAFDFELCDEERARQGQIYHPRYQEGKRDLRAYLLQEAQDLHFQLGESGHITLRFLVNCKGQSGRFRVEQLGSDYKTKIFDGAIVDVLLQGVQQIENWELPPEQDGFAVITCKIKDGQLVDVI